MADAIRCWTLGEGSTRCNTEAKALHLAAISEAVAPSRHAALLVNPAGWHTSAKLVGQHYNLAATTAVFAGVQPGGERPEFMRDHWLSNRVFDFYANPLDHCCDAWNKLTERP